MLDGGEGVVASPNDEGFGGDSGQASDDRPRIGFRDHRGVSGSSSGRGVERGEEGIAARTRYWCGSRVNRGLHVRAEQRRPDGLLPHDGPEDRNASNPVECKVVRWINKRIDEHELVDKCRMTSGQGEGNTASHRVTAHVDASEIERGYHVRDRVRKALAPVSITSRVRFFACAEPRKIRRNHAKRRRKRAHCGGERLVVCHRVVQQDDGGARWRNVRAKRFGKADPRDARTVRAVAGHIAHLHSGADSSTRLRVKSWQRRWSPDDGLEVKESSVPAPNWTPERWVGHDSFAASPRGAARMLSRCPPWVP